MVVFATLILAGVAIFTATRLYQLRKQAVAPNAPESTPLAWDCSNYNFSVEGSGEVKVSNNSQRDEAAQQAKVFINNNLVATLDVPALAMGASATIGTISVPQGSFNWRVEGTQDCSTSGTSTSGPASCSLLTFTLTAPTPTTPATTSTPSPTNSPVPSATTAPTATPTPTDGPIGGGESPSSTPTPNPSVTTVSQGSPAPTSTYIAQVSPTPGGDNLPAAGTSTPTLVAIFGGLFIIIISLALAI